MFGKKKKEETVTETVTPKKESLQSERTCVRCGAVCIRNAMGDFHCKFCGANFTDADAERIAKKLAQERAARKVVDAGAYQTEKIATVSVQSENTVKNDTMTKSAAPINVTFKQESNIVTAEMSSEDVYATNCNGVVEILTDCGRASGLIISKKGFVLTNAHAVLDTAGGVAQNIYVKHNGELVRSQLIAIGNTDSNDQNNVDLALLKMETVPSTAISLRLGLSNTSRIGQHVYYIGNSKGEGLCMTAGIISDNNRKVGERFFIMTDAATNPGNSGGPLFNDDGEVIGVHVSARNEADGMKYAIPVNTARLFLNTIEDQLGIPHDTIADNCVAADDVSTESVSAGVILTLVLSGITLLVKNIEFIKEIVDTISG